MIDKVKKIIVEELDMLYELEVYDDEIFVTNEDNGCGVMIKLEFMT